MPLLSVVLLVASGCTPSSDPPLPEAPQHLEVTLEDYRFVYDQAVPRGRVVVHVRNAGQVQHQLALNAIPEDFPPIDEQLRGETRRATRPIIDVTRPPGADAVFAVDLEPGRYAFICFLEDADGIRHYLKGMSAEFRVA
jgi:hypothetical protein